MAHRPAHTYSIIAQDPANGQFGVGVQSHYLCAAAEVGWAEAGIGVVATQAWAEISYGPLGLALMRAGKTAGQALQSLLASDPQARLRQVAMLDANGGVAAHTGDGCAPYASHRSGQNYCVQANLMLRPTVCDAMAQAYANASGDLAARLLAALEAAEAEGGDIRGRQSAGLLVVGGPARLAPWQGRIYDLRVDDHPQPLPELRRLLALARAYEQANRAQDILADASRGEARLAQALEAFEPVRLAPEMVGNPELIFWFAVDLAVAGHLEPASLLFKQAFDCDPAWRTLALRLDTLKNAGISGHIAEIV
jgi:uncharacterized Ntn-hydrolase superfamily protein